MAFKLRPYQEDIVDFIVANPRCYVGAYMGSGKTVATLTALDNLTLIDDVWPALIIAPLRVANSTWPNEVHKFPWLNYLVVQSLAGVSAAQREKALRQPAHVYTINYENIGWLVNVLGKKWPFKTLVCDEASKLRGYRSRGGTQRARSIYNVAYRSDRMILLSGTPAPNGLDNLWGQFKFIDDGKRLLPTYTAFQSRWFSQNEYTRKWTIKDQRAVDEIHSRIADVMVSVNPADYLTVKEPIRIKVNVVLPDAVQKQYATMEKKFFVELQQGGKIEAVSAAAKSQKLLQLAAGAAYDKDDDSDSTIWHDIHSAKLDALESIVEESGGEPILVSYTYRFDIPRIMKRFPDAVVLDKKPSTLTRWNEGKIPMLLAHPASAGHGLSMQEGGRILVYLNQTWDLELHQQIAERLGSIRQAQSGLDRTVYIYSIIATGTIEEDVIDRLEGKKSVQEVLLNAMKRRGLDTRKLVE